jgi:hypothetical protein
MLRHALLLLPAGLCLAQNPADVFEKAPPDVDQAIRARVSKFYQAHVDGKFRAADEVVHEDSKDAFFEAEKTKYRGFEIGKINYSDNFTKAVVTVLVDHDYISQLGRIPIKMPLLSNWKLEAGQWWWYTKPQEDDGYYTTIFGRVKKPTNGVAGGEAPRGQASLPAMPDPIKLLSGVKADKNEVQLSGSPASAQVVIQNQMPGNIELRVELENGWPGLTASFDTVKLNADDKATLTVRDTGKPLGRPAVAKVHIDPTQQVIPIKIIPAQKQ